jgi:hypothetical protein
LVFAFVFWLKDYFLKQEMQKKFVQLCDADSGGDEKQKKVG